MKKLVIGTVLLLCSAAAPAHAVTLNLNTGWNYDEANPSLNGGVSVESAVEFNLSNSAVFSLVDCCNLGDIWNVTGTFSGTSSFTAPVYSFATGLGEYADLADDEWFGGNHSILQVLLGPGIYSLNIVIGSALLGPNTRYGVSYRIDAVASPVPIPAALPMLAAALGGVGIAGWRRRKKM